jgi:bilin biosynthesis protein
MRSPNDLFLSRLWRAADLMRATPARRVAWRQALVKQLAQLLLTPNLPSFLRTRALAALAESGESSVRLLFRRLVDHADPQLRAKAVLGLGILQDPQDLSVIEPALGDPDLDVRLASIDALRRLARAGSESALESIVTSIVEAENQVQRAAAEALAELGPEGEAVLRDAAQDQDLTVRRAAVYGLILLDADWVEETLEQLHRQDSEWLVRNAASDALTQLADEKEGAALEAEDLVLPKAEQASWLIAWAAERGEGTGVGDAAMATLVRALQEGDAEIRQAAVDTLGRLADPSTCDVLRQCLRDPEPAVRNAALFALYQISCQHDLTLTR